MSKECEFYKFEFECNLEDFDRYDDILDAQETIVWYNFLVEEKLQKLIDFFGLCESNGIDTLKDLIEEEISFECADIS